MAIRYDNVIVFGPTGAVGSVAAQEASKRGAKVWLAMRDTSKDIKTISAEEEAAGKFTRVSADLTDAESVRGAVEKSGAKAAFVYLTFAPSGIGAAVRAMKEAGVEYIVFLSSFTIPQGRALRDISEAEVIPYMHAAGEIAIEDAGVAHTALRPGAFASNSFKMNMDYTKTPIEIYAFKDGAQPVDNIVPTDIGRVAGAVLVDRPNAGDKEIVYLYGPVVRSELEVFQTIKGLYPREVSIVKQQPDEWTARLHTKGIPPAAVAYMRKTRDADDRSLFAPEIARAAAANIKKYSGYEPTTLEGFMAPYLKK